MKNKKKIYSLKQIKKMISKPDILYVHCDEDDLMVEMPKVILKGIDEFIAVVNKLNPEIIFYEETYLSPNMFLIEEEDVEDSALYDLDEELANEIMEDIEFQKCTTKQKRKEWTLKYCAFHPDCIDLFDGVVDDLHMSDFIEDIWERLSKTPSK